MLGAISGDIIGSVFESAPCHEPKFPLFSAESRFTDDTVLTIATAHALLDGLPFENGYRSYGRLYPDAGYSSTFSQWIATDRAGPYRSWSNGSAMRVSPVGWAYDVLDEVLNAAERTASVSHNHPDGIAGAQAVAVAVFLARTGESKSTIRAALSDRFGYDLTRRAIDIREHYTFDVSCRGSVPEALICFLDSNSFEEAIRFAVLLGGDADTQSCIAGAVAEAFYGGVPSHIAQQAVSRLPGAFRQVLRRFAMYYHTPVAETGVPDSSFD